jgi:hypothetical protein
VLADATAAIQHLIATAPDADAWGRRRSRIFSRDIKAFVKISDRNQRLGCAAIGIGAADPGRSYGFRQMKPSSRIPIAENPTINSLFQALCFRGIVSDVLMDQPETVSDLTACLSVRRSGWNKRTLKVILL